jgi:hypothetical protein
MRKDTLRRDAWLAVGSIAVLVAVLWVFVPFSRQVDRPQEAPASSSAEDDLDIGGAMRLPEGKELKSNYPLRPKGLTREKAVRVIELTRHSNPALRARAVGQLGFVDEDSRKEALVILSDKLRDPHSYVRIMAMDALAALDAKDHIPLLLPFLNSENSDDRACAKRALTRLGHSVE